MMIFRSTDKRIVEAPREDWSVDDDGEPIPAVIVEYAATAGVVRDRLNLMGYTLEFATRAFNQAIERERESHRDLMDSYGRTLPPNFEDTKGPVLCELTPVQWMSGLREIDERGIERRSASDGSPSDLSPLLMYMLDTHADGWYGFSIDDIRIVLRLGVEACPNSEVVYDLSELVNGGYYDSSDDLVADAEFLLAEDFALSRRVVVLTEGATDKWILERSLRLLRPHLADFFAFMDFEGAKVAGGATALAQMVKAFASAGILNRVVAVFDNDAAGSDVVAQLSSIRLPANIVVLQLPRLALAECYPTIGPTGSVEADVNGLAAGIELYLGRDVLEIDGSLVPVQWRGFNERARKYQGEPLRKAEIHRRFELKVKACESDASRLINYDWSGLELIAERLCGAFSAPADQADEAPSEGTP